MNVAFLNPMFGVDFTKSARWFARSRGRVQRHPDYLAIAAATVEQAGHRLFFCDAQAKNMPTEVLLPKLREFKPDLIVYQATTPSIDCDIAAAARCKEATGAMNVFVGPHVSAEPQDTLERAEGAVDAVTIGEYDYTLRDLANGVRLEDCLGLVWLDQGTVRTNPARPRIDNLDELPFPAWKHIDIHDYHDAGKLFPFLTLISGRGCRAACTFCQLPQVMNGRSYRTRSIEHILGEIDYDVSLFPNLREIMFEDDTLTMRGSEERLTALCEALLRRRSSLTWSANARVDVNDYELLRLMKRSGCRMLCVGFEFGDPDVLLRIGKGATVDQMHTFAENAHRAGIRVHGCFMFGGPGETRETARRTIDLACTLPIDTAQFSGVVAYPGTAYYQWAKKSGYLVPQRWRDWVDADGEQVTTVSLPDLSATEINALIDDGLRAFYTRPSQMWRMATNIRSMADVRAKWHGVKSFLAYFRTRTPQTSGGDGGQRESKHS